MPFHMSFCASNKVHIQLRVVKDTMGFYFFGGTKADKQAALVNLNSIIKPAWYAMRESIHFVRGPDAIHLKLHHSCDEELEDFHTHYQFSKKVDPDMLQRFLKGMLEAQRRPENQIPQRQFISRDDVGSIIFAFSKYHEAYHGSEHAKAYERETALSEHEAAMVARLPRTDADQALGSLLRHMLLAPSVPSAPPATGVDRGDGYVSKCLLQ